LVALLRDIRTSEKRAIHRTALTADGRKIDRRSLGPMAGTAIKLCPDGEITLGLTIGEGIETTLAGAQHGFWPAWAAGNAGGMANFPVLAGIECLALLVDNDKPGQEAALRCSRRWTAAGREVFRVVPRVAGADMADLVEERAA
jgi:hypothetical protein